MNGTLVIIGNGFDLNLGLKTSYNDFLKSPYFINLLQTTGKDGNYLAHHLKKVGDKSTWIDAEQEIYLYYRNKKRSTLSTSHLFIEFNEIRNSLCNYISSIDVTKMDENSSAYQWAKNLNFQHLSSTPLYVLNFNYTNCFQLITQNESFQQNWGAVKYFNVHGDLSNKNIILGLSDEAELDSETNYLRKSSFPNYGMQINEHILENCADVYFFGHSLGESDHNYFKTFFTSNTTGDRILSPPKNITIFHYGMNSYYYINNQIWKLTNNNSSKFKIRNNVTFIDLLK